MRLRASLLRLTSVAILFGLSACSGGRAPGEGPQIPPPPDVAAPPADALRTSTNLASKVITPGTGTRHPRPNSMVTVHYTGWTTDGRMFDSSVARGEPSHFGVDRVIRGWTEGLQMMVEGEKRRFWIPGGLAYDGAPGKPQGMLVFDVELIRIDS
jgi:peptidylprolyl isomerase